MYVVHCVVVCSQSVFQVCIQDCPMTYLETGSMIARENAARLAGQPYCNKDERSRLICKYSVDSSDCEKVELEYDVGWGQL